MQLILKNTLFLVTILSVTLLLQSCSFFTPYKAPITQGSIINQDALNTLQSGLTMDQVQDILGPPLGKDAFEPRHWEYVFYTTDKSFHPDAIKHVIVQFDDEFYLDKWQIINQNVQLNQ